uniref:Uncharacterized protein n=1 Tax=Panagrolaimus davidi TaxID=227884 RepID=A0A914P041_9BILA
MTHLLAFDKNHNFQYQGFCKVVINRMNSLLCIEPKNEEFKLISAYFKWNFVMRKNLLFGFAEFNFLDFCLVFKNERLCQKVFSYIPSKQEEVIQETDKENMIKDRFLLPMFQKIHENSVAHFEVIQLIAAWIRKFDEEAKEQFKILMKECKIFEPIFAEMEGLRVKEISQKVLQNPLNRKRKIDEICKRSIGLVLPKLTSYTTIYQQSQIQIGYSGRKNGVRPKLLVFTSPELTTFHLYTYISHRSVYACQECKWKNTAIVDVDKNRNICAKLTTKEHLCPTQNVIPESFVESKVVKKPNYEIIDRGKYKLNGKTLIIFDSIDKEFCYEYFEQKSMFYCLACMGMKPQRKTVKAKVHFEGTEKEYVEIICNEHICKKRKYQPENYQKIHEFVLKPNFEIQRYTKHGTEKKKLIVFNENDKSLCYSYYYDSRRESYVCKNCSKKGKLVTAKLLQNSEEEEYIILSIVKHICNLKPYVPLKGELTINSSQIKLMKETKNGLPKLFVFVGNDKKKCYIFTTFRHTLTTQKYYCTGCRVKIDGRKSVRNEFKEMVSGYLVTDKNGKHSLKLPANYKHICSPKNFEPDEFKSLPKSYDFFFFKENNDRGIPQLAIIHPAEKNLCFHFRFNKHCRHFICKKCEKEKKKNLTLVIQMDESGKAYFNHDYKKHSCKPQKILSILGPKIRKLKDDEINHNDYLKSKQQKKPKEKIINLPNFELCTSKTGVKDAKLILFHETDKNLCA